MPIYEYRCKSCGRTFEVIQKFSDRPLRKCGDCSGRLEKLISRTAFQLKGGGWYVHDYQKGSAAKPRPSEAGSKGPGESAAASSRPSGGSEGSS